MGNNCSKPPPKPVNSSLLKHAIANQINDASVYQTNENVNREDLDRFERVLSIVRDKSPREHWENLVYIGSHSNTGDFEKTLHEIVKHISVDSFNSRLMFVLYTFVVDVAAFKMKKGQSVDVDSLLNVTLALIIKME